MPACAELLRIPASRCQALSIPTPPPRRPWSRWPETPADAPSSTPTTFGKVFTGVQQDTLCYYLLGYHSANAARDGRFRRITVRVNRPGVKIDFRRGYYAPADFQHSTRDDRERQLDEELASDLSTTDLPVYLSAAYFRLAERKFYVPVSVVVPGSQIPFTHNNDQDRATLDVLGVVTDPDKRPVGQIRDTVKLALNASQAVQRKNVQYNSGFVLPPGHLSSEVRSPRKPDRTAGFVRNRSHCSGPEVRAGEDEFDRAGEPTAECSQGNKTDNPLVRDGSEVIPSVTHVFSAGQHLYFYYEVYDPAAAVTNTGTSSNNRSNSAIRLLTNVAFFRGNTKAYETPLVESQQLNAPDRKAAVFQLDVPLTQLKPGFYTCQVNVIDDAAGQFRFPRLALLVRQ